MPAWMSPAHRSRAVSAAVAWLLLAMAIRPAARGSVETVDPAFTPEGPAKNQRAADVQAIVPLPDGDVLVGGYFFTWGQHACSALVRLHPDGSVDQPYYVLSGTSGGVVSRIIVDGTGRLYICGAFDSVGGLPRRNIFRLLADGNVDSAFVPDLGPDDIINDVALSPDGTALWIAGDSSPAPARTPLIKLSTTDGARVPGTAAPVLGRTDGFVPAIRSIAVLADGSLFAGGDFLSVNNQPAPLVARFDANARFIGTWAGGRMTRVNTVRLLRPKHLLLANYAPAAGGMFAYQPLLRVNVDGTWEEPVDFRAPVMSSVHPDLRIPWMDPDGRIYVVGEFETTPSAESPAADVQTKIARLFPDGALDPSFTPQVNAAVESVVRDAAGRLLIGGQFSSVDGVAAPGLARLLMDGDRPVVEDAAARTIESVEGKMVRLPASVYGQEGDLIWSRDGKEVARTSDSELVLFNVTPGESGQYTYTATNRHGTTAGPAMQVTIHPIAPGLLDPDLPKTVSQYKRTWMHVADRHEWVSFDGRTLTYCTEDFVPFASHDIADPIEFYTATGMAPLKDGGFVLLGAGARKFDADGKEDKAFHIGRSGSLRYLYPAGDNGYWAVVADADDHLVRLFADGSVDPGFVPIDRAGPLALQPDGKLLVFRPLEMFSRTLALERYQPDGTLDGSFAPSQDPAAYGVTGDIHFGLGRILVAPDSTIIISTDYLNGGSRYWWLAGDGHVIRTSVAAETPGNQCRLVAAVAGGIVFVVSDTAGIGWIGDDRTFHACESPPPSSNASIAEAVPTTRGLVIRQMALDQAVYRYTTRTNLGSPLLMNLSGRGVVGEGDDALIAGFVTAGTGTQDLLIRGVGPALRPFGVSNVATDPVLDLYQQQTLLQTVDNWGDEDAGGRLSAAFGQYGAFGLPSGSKDAAFLRTVSSGSFTVQVRPGAGVSGVALAELYGGRSTAQTLQNISIRGAVGEGEQVLNAGFVLGGDVPSRVLIRVVGPGLKAFGVSRALADPVLTVYSGTTQLAQNDDWIDGGQQAAIAAANRQVGAFPLSPTSLDSALLMELDPGAYSAVATAKDGTSGPALVEVYWIDNHAK